MKILLTFEFFVKVKRQTLLEGIQMANKFRYQMANTFHIGKWIFVAISNFSKIDEIISELTALILKDHISSLLSAIYF